MQQSSKMDKTFVDKVRTSKRTVFKDADVKILEELYAIHSYPSPEVIDKLAAQIGCRQSNIKIWFQNRRARSKGKNTQNVTGHHSNTGYVSGISGGIGYRDGVHTATSHPQVNVNTGHISGISGGIGYRDGVHTATSHPQVNVNTGFASGISGGIGYPDGVHTATSHPQVNVNLMQTITQQYKAIIEQDEAVTKAMAPEHRRQSQISSEDHLKCLILVNSNGLLRLSNDQLMATASFLLPAVDAPSIQRFNKLLEEIHGNLQTIFNNSQSVLNIHGTTS